jgi:hypothetical protein
MKTWKSISDWLMLLQLWKVIGNQQPSKIMVVEKRLWRVLFDIVSVNTTIPDLLATALADISAMDVHDPSTNYASWFMAGETMVISFRTY